MPGEYAYDYKFCANCSMHNWGQPEDKSSLKLCPGCRLIFYCDEVCRKEHRRKVHKNHCQFLADPSKCPESQHDAETCDMCRPNSETGKGKRKMAVREKKKKQVSSSYECFIIDVHFAPGIASPHPFPLAGVGDGLLERTIIVVQKLFHKLKQNLRVAKTCSTELEKIERFLWVKRMEMWRNRKIFSHDKMMYMDFDFIQIEDLIVSVKIKLEQGKAGKDASELWKIILVVTEIQGHLVLYYRMAALKNPIDSIPEQFKDLVKLAADNKSELLNIIEEIIDSLSTQVVSHEDIIKKLCGGKKRQNCSFCGVKISEVTEYFDISYLDKCSSVLFDSLSIRKYSCGRQDCLAKASSRMNNTFKLSVAVVAACNERRALRCDFCFQLCPIDEAHRCCNCLTVMYCSKSCHKKDKEEHKKSYCIEDERKTKEDRSTRRQEGEIRREKTGAGHLSETDVTGVAIVKETLEAFQLEESKSTKGDSPEREHDAKIPEAATVPTAEDDGSKSGTGAANTEHVNDRSTPCAGAADAEHINEKIPPGAGEDKHGRSASRTGAASGVSISEVD